VNFVHYRVLSGCTYGLGHVVRARWLAEALRDRLGLMPLFFELSGFAPAQDYLKSAGLPVHPNFVPSPQAPVLEVIDGLDAPEEVILEARLSGAPVLCFENEAPSARLADVVVNPIIAGLETRHWTKSGVPHHGGASYLLLNPEIRRWKSLRLKPSPPRAENILISCGGTDPAGRMALALDWLEALRFEGIVNLVLGGGGPAAPILSPSLRVRVHRNLPTLAPLLHQTDLALISGGMTMYEAACLGVPSAVIPQNDHQILNAERFQARGASLLLDPANPSASMASLQHLIDTSATRQLMSECGRNILSGDAPDLFALVETLIR